MSGLCRELPHTADPGMRVEADALAELFERSALGMFGLMFDLAALRPNTEAGVAVEAPHVS